MMLLFLLILAGICLYGIRISHFHEDYMGVSQTTSIKGIFITIVLLSHANSYIEMSNNIANSIYRLFFSLLGQLMVTLFLFYSGFGVMESYKNKEGYERNFIKNRIGKTLLHFDIALVLFVILNAAIGKTYPIGNYIWCWIGWKAIGNSNWFIFVILLLYLLTYFSFMFQRYNQKDLDVIWIITALFSAGFWLFLYFTKEVHWYNTLFCYVLGMVYSLYKTKIDSVMRNNIVYALVIIGLSIVFIFIYLFRRNVIAYSLCACVFSILIVVITMKIKVDNRILRFMGKYLFPIFILQRLPMIFMKYLGVQNPVIFTLFAIVITIPLAVIFDKCMKYIDKRVFK